MARMKAKAEQQGYEADAAKEMATSFEGGDSLEKNSKTLGRVARVLKCRTS